MHVYTLLLVAAEFGLDSSQSNHVQEELANQMIWHNPNIQFKSNQPQVYSPIGVGGRENERQLSLSSGLSQNGDRQIELRIQIRKLNCDLQI